MIVNQQTNQEINNTKNAQLNFELSHSVDGFGNGRLPAAWAEINFIKPDVQLALFEPRVDTLVENRWKENRRREPSEGYTYISTVGWIDRRERLRRKDDPYNFF